MAQAETDVILALYIGESFVEAHLSCNQKLIHFNRWYLGKEGLKSGLQKFFKESGELAGVEKASKAFVASRFVEKIFAYRLGGSVATLTTKGFENWPTVRQPATQKVGPLSSVDLVFAVDERCNANGVLEKEVSDTEIAELIEKLKAKSAKRICIHFLNAAKNPHNQNKLKEALLKENLEVFTPNHSEPMTDEVSAWRKNILNASLSGTFEEIQEELNEGLKPYLPEGERAAFYAADAKVFDRENNQRLSSLWGAYGAWSRGLAKKNSAKFDILYLGLEQFCVLHPEKQCQIWKSPWGTIQAPQVKSQMLSLQPTSAIAITPWGELAFAKNALGYEPGPMFMGRGQVPTLLDLWGENTSEIKGVAERKSAQGMQKFKNQLLALNKTSSTPYETEPKLLKGLQQLAFQKLSSEIALQTENSKVVCIGALASLFVPELKKRLPHLQFELLPETETSSLLSQGPGHVV